jgi:hypothetical protein
MKGQPNVEFSGLPDNAHRCTGEVNGDWVTFRCPLCPEYSRKINLLTGETVATGKNEFVHFGSPNSFSNALALMQTAGKN